MHNLTAALCACGVLMSPLSHANPLLDISKNLNQKTLQQIELSRVNLNEVTQFSAVSSHQFYRQNQRIEQRESRQVFYHSKKETKSERKYYRAMPSRIEPQGKPTFVFNPKNLSWGAYNADGRLINSGRASGGKSYCADVGRACKTPRGEFTVYREGSASCRSSKYPLGRGGAKMPYCMFFYKGYAIHGSPDVPNHNASHGCIRVPPSDAKWLSHNFIDPGTKVIVKSY